LRSIPAENTPPRPGQHADPQVRVGVELVDGRGDRARDVLVQRVLGPGPVDRDQQDAVPPLDEHLLLGSDRSGRSQL
jgi:hypothetical protein